jgi:hypothetical protein
LLGTDFADLFFIRNAAALGNFSRLFQKDRRRRAFDLKRKTFVSKYRYHNRNDCSVESFCSLIELRNELTYVNAILTQSRTYRRGRRRLSARRLQFNLYYYLFGHNLFSTYYNELTRPLGKFEVPKVQFSFKVVPGAPELVSMLVIEA